MVFKVIQLEEAGLSDPDGPRHEFEPPEDIVGAVVFGIGMDLLVVENEHGDELVVRHGNRVAPLVADMIKDEIDDGTERESTGSIQKIWTCATRDGRIFKFFDHELELVRS